MKILVIDDNPLLVEGLSAHLGERYIIESARTATSGIEHAENGHFDIIILDLGLPDMKGDKVCQTIRNKKICTPILVVTGNDDVDSKIRLLELGADDYITKPFSAGELRARLQALSRRDKKIQPEMLVIGALKIDPASRRVEREGKEIKLRRKEFDILEYLARNRGKIVTRPMIIDNVWESGKESWNNTVDVHIKYLRDKVDRPFKDHLIKTAYGVGYVIEASNIKS